MFSGAVSPGEAIRQQVCSGGCEATRADAERVVCDGNADAIAATTPSVAAASAHIPKVVLIAMRHSFCAGAVVNPPGFRGRLRAQCGRRATNATFCTHKPANAVVERRRLPKAGSANTTSSLPIWRTTTKWSPRDNSNGTIAGNMPDR